MKIILFDINGTLINAGGAGKQSMIQAFNEVFGIECSFDGIVMAGNTDPGILQQVFQIHKLYDGFDKIEQFKNCYFKLITEKINLNLLEKRVYPGAK